jgi:predicted SnoaL-like aldol condensation-catalyzing enzyme
MRTMFVMIAATIALVLPQAASAKETPKQLVTKAVDAIFGARDTAAVDRYLSPGYTQHNPLVPDGPAALKALIQQFKASPTYKYERFRLIADGNLVAVHGRYTGIRPQPLVAFDLFRVKGGKIVEHWDALQAEGPPNPSGRTLVDGPTEVAPGAPTAKNRALVSAAMETIMIQNDFARLGEFFDLTRYAQHNSQFPDGATTLVGGLKQLQAAGRPLIYKKVHRLIAEGDFVLTQSEASFGGAPFNIMDLFQVANGKLVEHWDVLQQLPANPVNTNSPF